MIGVILWSDAPLTKAVIWCDDQGDLAFFSNKAGVDFPELHPGDWVEFDITLSGNIRVAENLAIVMEQGSPGLADRLCATADCGGSAEEASEQEQKVVLFPLQAAKERRVSAPLQFVQM
ncbi:cold shock domain-containing protein [Leisingera daeponensis]|uniref:cold shock domain-containing protein n=1 Tax=Leisingera daeponensis TaxID=405746 RepID=UPI001C94BB05|nr:cold shock domain-containing protein [Leisingera daeponensis]MBY6054977.1 cold shock domain-containing protein [Leisingera daeponensis]